MTADRFNQEGFSIRAALPSDLEGLAALYPHLNPSDEPISRDLATARLDAINQIPGSTVLLGLLHDELVASCTLIVIPNLTRGGKPYGLIENVVTHAGYRGQGYGTSILHAAAKVSLAGLVVSVDRQERASETSARSALAEVGAEFGMPTAAIVTIDEVVEHLGTRLTDVDRARIADYRAKYGATRGS